MELIADLLGEMYGNKVLLRKIVRPRLLVGGKFPRVNRNDLSKLFTLCDSRTCQPLFMLYQHTANASP